MVNLVWSNTNGGSSLGSIVDHGDSSNGATTTARTLFLRHDGLNNITNVGLYIRSYTGTYSGSATAIKDLAEIISWGDATTASTFGGFQFNFLATTTFPAAAWPTYNEKLGTPSGGNVGRTGVGDSEGNAITLPTTTGATTSGTIQAGASPNVRFQVRIQVPIDEDTLGIRQWDLAVRYTYTS